MLSAQVGLHVHTMTKWASTLVHRHQACILTPSTGRGIFVHSCKAINQWQPKHPLEQAGRWPQSFLRHCASLICRNTYCQTATFLPCKPTSGKLQQWLSQTALCPSQSKQNDTQTHTGCPSVWTAYSQQDCVSQQRCIHQCQQGHRKTLQTKPPIRNTHCPGSPWTSTHAQRRSLLSVQWRTPADPTARTHM